jgi:hypothetical protein
MGWEIEIDDLCSERFVNSKGWNGAKAFICLCSRAGRKEMIKLPGYMPRRLHKTHHLGKYKILEIVCNSDVFDFASGNIKELGMQIQN